MDNVTHTLFALTLARTPLGRGRGATTALVLASNAPDIDIVALAGGATNYLHWHRGPTHGPLGVVVLGLATAAIVSVGQRFLDKDTSERRASFAMLAAVSTAAVLLHVLMDLPTAYGTRISSPFDWHWYAADWLPIVDIYLLIILAAGLLFGRSSPAARRRNVGIALVLMATNYGIRGVAHEEALARAPRLFGPTLPRPCDNDAAAPGLIDRWPREQPVKPAATGSEPSGHRCLVEIAALPTFASPFRWRVIAQMLDAYEIHDIDLLDPRFRTPATAAEVMWRLSIRYPNQWTPAVFKAAATDLGRIYLGFARFPAARSAVDSDGDATVRWTDMRFVGGLIALDQPMRQSNLFTALVRLNADGQILQEELGR